MEGRSSTRSLSCILLAMLFLSLFFSNSGIVKAQVDADYPNIRVNRVVQIVNGGAVLVNDTITLSANVSQNVQSLNSFQIGFPIAYRDNLTYYFAYDDAGKLTTTRRPSYRNRTDFHWIKVSFLQPVNVSDGGFYNFTVVYLFSGLVKFEAAQSFRLDLPLYPGLAEKAEFCNVTVTFPAGATYTSYSSVFVNKTLDSRKILYNETSPLEAYANVSSWARFASSSLMWLEVNEMRREMKIDGLGGLSGTDFYQITIRNVEKITFVLPPNATVTSVQDVFGAYDLSTVTVVQQRDYTTAEVSIRNLLLTGENVEFLVLYNLPFGKYIAQSGWQDYALNVSVVRPVDWIMKQFIVAILLPEGANFQSSSSTPSIKKAGFTETVRFVKDNVTRFHEFNFDIKYQYLILWASFRPILWAGTAVAIIGVVFFLRRTAKPEVTVTAPFSPDVLRKFVYTYDERRRITAELESLEQRVQRGKVSRRQYRLRRSSLDGRLSKLQKDSAQLRREIEAAGGRYADTMKKLEVAETEIETLNRDIERLEVRYRNKELSAEAYRRLLDEYNRRKEKAENTITEIILRFKEEIH